MKKISALRSYVYVVLFASFILLSNLVIVNKVFAASAGCYDRNAGSQTDTKVVCPSDLSVDVANGKCFLKTIVPKQISQYELYKCESIRFENAAQFQINPAGDCGQDSGGCITDDIQIAINVLSVGVGIVITGVIVVAGLQYITSRDNPQAVQSAKKRILNAIISLAAYVFVYAFLQWVVPGGIF